MGDDGVADAAGALRVPGYVVGERIGAGGFGEVYRARHAVIDREVALKVLHAKYSADPEAVARFVAEARAVNKISHPNIVEISDFGQLADGRQYCVMELIRGTTLRDVLRERGRLPLAEALPILRGIAEAVDAAHAAGIAHRDLKPDNVFVIEGGGIKLIDFGLAKLTHEEAVPVTQTGSVFGTPLYMSPEQCRGKQVTLATDAYSFGVLAYQLLTGETPFTGDALELALHHLNDDPQPPSTKLAELGARCDRVVLALLAKDPAQRPRPLVPVVDAIVEGALPARPRRRRPRLIVLGIGALVVAGAAAFALAPREHATPADDCTPAAQRLATIWDPAVRVKLIAHYAGKRDDVSVTGRVLSANLDAYATKWARQWGEACHSGDRAKDPLLYGQRITCLDNALLVLRGYTQAITSIDPLAFSEGYLGVDRLAALPDCETPAVLRAQSPAPPPELREKVGALVSAVQIGRAHERTGNNAMRPAMVVQGLAELEASAKALDELHVPEAAIGWYWHADLMVTLIDPDPQSKIDPLSREERIKVTRETIEIATKRATELRNDLALAAISTTALDLEQRVGDAAKIEAAMAAAEAAIARAGNPMRERALLANRRAGYFIDRKDFERARRELDAEVDIMKVVEPAVYTRVRDENAARLAEAMGDFETVIAKRHEVVANTLAVWGPIHRRTIDARVSLYGTLEITDHLREARDELEKVLAVRLEVHADQPGVTDTRMRLGLLSTRLGEDDRAKEFLRDIPATDAASWAELTNRAMMFGSLELATWCLAQVAPDAITDDIEGWRAYLAFMHGDYSAIRAHAASAHRAPIGRLFLRFTDALAGKPSTVPANTDPDFEGIAVGLEGIARRRWREAATGFRAMIDAYRKQLSDQDEQLSWNVAEGLAWLGHSLVEVGDLRGAIAPLDESLQILDRCCHGFNYFSPMAQLALARALWETGGDKARARTLAEQARDGFARLGTFREPERQQAIAWLAAHRAN